MVKEFGRDFRTFPSPSTGLGVRVQGSGLFGAEGAFMPRPPTSKPLNPDALSSCLTGSWIVISGVISPLTWGYNYNCLTYIPTHN